MSLLAPTLAIYILGGTAAFCVTAFGLLYSATSSIERKGEDFYEENLEGSKRLKSGSRKLLQDLVTEATSVLDYEPSTAIFAIERTLQRYRVRGTAPETIAQLKEDYTRLHVLSLSPSTLRGIDVARRSDRSL